MVFSFGIDDRARRSQHRHRAMTCFALGASGMLGRRRYSMASAALAGGAARIHPGWRSGDGASELAAVAIHIPARSVRVVGRAALRAGATAQQNARTTSSGMDSTAPACRHLVTRLARHARCVLGRAVSRVRSLLGPRIFPVAVTCAASVAAVAKIDATVHVKNLGANRGARGVCLFVARGAGAGIVVHRRRTVAISALHRRRVGPKGRRTSATGASVAAASATHLTWLPLDATSYGWIHHDVDHTVAMTAAKETDRVDAGMARAACKAAAALRIFDVCGMGATAG